jgi:4-aminobutyrate aminotransferase-like enzyme
MPNRYRPLFSRDYREDEACIFKLYKNRVLNATNLPRIRLLRSELPFGRFGTVAPTDEFIQEMWRFCMENEITWGDDSVQSGFRAGRPNYYFQGAGIVPTFISLGKLLAAHFNLSLLIVDKRYDAFPGARPATMGGNLLNMFVASKVLKELREENLHEQIQQVSDFIHRGLLTIQAESSVIGDVRAKKMLMATEIIDPNGTQDVWGVYPPDSQMADRIAEVSAILGLYLVNAQQNVRWQPPMLSSFIEAAAMLCIYRYAIRCSENRISLEAAQQELRNLPHEVTAAERRGQNTLDFANQLFTSFS